MLKLFDAPGGLTHNPGAMGLLTILAEGRVYALLGLDSGEIIAIPKGDLHTLSSGYKRPALIPAPPKSVPQVGGYRPVPSLDLPPGVIVYCEYHTLHGITIYAVCYDCRWYLRELRNADGDGSGLYFREG